MEAERNGQSPKVRKHRRIYRLGILLVLGLFLLIFLIAAVSGFIGYNMVRSVTPPPTLPLSALVRKPVAGAPEQAKSSTADIPSTLSRVADLKTSSTPAGGEGKRGVSYELIPEAAQLTLELKGKARQVNEAFTRLMDGFDKFYQFEKPYRIQDPKKPYRKVMADWTTEKREAYLNKMGELYSPLREQTVQLIHMIDKDFPASSKQFDKAYLGMCEANQDWFAAANYCYGFRINWDGAIYYCRKADSSFLKVAGVVSVAVRAAFHSAAKIKGSLNGRQ